MGETDRQIRVTTADVARAAGLSRATVSYALNGDPDGRLAPHTRERVLDAARRLGYHPSASARLLRGGRSHTVLMLSSAADGYTSPMAGVLEELARALALRGLNLVWQLVVPGMKRPVGELSPAVVLTAATHDDADHHAMAQGFQVPVVDAFPGRDAFIAAAATAQVGHLADRGHRRIAYLVPPPGPLDLITGLRTPAAVAEARRRRLLKPRVVSWPPERLARSALVTRLQEDGVTALCAFNDEVALAALLAAHDAGLDVPGALAVVGVDDVPSAAVSWPPLTSVRADTAPFSDAMSDYVTALARGERLTVPPMPVTFAVVHREST